LYWLIRRSAATSVASLFYLVQAVPAVMAFFLFGERLDAITGMARLRCRGVCGQQEVVKFRLPRPAVTEIAASNTPLACFSICAIFDPQFSAAPFKIRRFS
jgi:hypothetical protein